MARTEEDPAVHPGQAVEGAVSIRLVVISLEVIFEKVSRLALGVFCCGYRTGVCRLLYILHFTLYLLHVARGFNFLILVAQG